MAHLTGSERSRYVQGMFNRIAHRYDLMNRVMTGGQDRRWRKEVILKTRLPEGGRLLDLGAGTGDLAHEVNRQYPLRQVVAADFSFLMMQTGKQHYQTDQLDWCGTDALQLPFEDETFDAVISGFLLRNVSDIELALNEQHRVLKPGGRVVTLDTTRPKPSVFTPMIKFYTRIIIPAIGGLLTGSGDAYHYLPQSTELFLSAEQLAGSFERAGFNNVGFQCKMVNTVAIHWGEKPGRIL
jgi:demethylmenaquinone methyltransferase / 2-methoxy-6-polyprenyl-1,4-benzoquinol methylase